MPEATRVKKYYRKRVLIDTERVLDPQFDDSLLCITGAQLEMLRNLTQYLHRRSTFVSEYNDQYYLAPTEEEWDSLQAIVADLEETLMGCEDLVTALDNIAAQVACLCLKSSSQPTYTPVTQDIVNYFVDDGVARHDNPYPSATVADGDRCAVAQLVWQGAFEWLTELIQPAQDLATDALIPLVMVLIASWVGPVVFLIPTGVLLAALWRSIETWETGEFESVKNTLISIKEEVICALYEGLVVNAREASKNAREVIYAQDLAPGDKICLSLLCGPWMVKVADDAWSTPTAWATSNVTAGYCDECEELEEDTEFTWTWPPCPGTHHKDGGVCYGDPLVKCFHGGIDDAHQQHIVDAVTYNRVDFEIRYRSKFGSGWTVGAVKTEVWDAVGDEWDFVCMLSAHNDQVAGALNTLTDTLVIGPPQDGGLHRSLIEGADGQGDEEPYPFAIEYLRIKYYTV